jgi:hypothetical protein
MAFEDEFVDREQQIQHPEYESTIETLETEGILPIGKLPDIRCINGAGLTLYGRRDFHSESGSYITTLYFVLCFVPLLPLRRFRIKPISSNYYLVSSSNQYQFLWRLPLTKQQKIHRIMFFIILGLFVAMVVWRIGG